MPPAISLLSREAQLLLSTAGGSCNDPILRQLLKQGLDWPKVCWLAEWEKAASTIWQRLSTLGSPPQQPGQARLSLQKLAMVSEFQSLHLEGLLRHALGVLAAARIEVMLLKGSAVAYTAYSSFTDRPMGDLDLLGQPDQARDAWSLLQKRGWAWDSDQFPVERYAGHQHLPPLIDSGGSGVRLELHTELFAPGNPFDVSAASVWRDRQSIVARHQRVLVPNIADQLLHLCIHFAWAHGMQFGAWRTFRDVHAVVANGGLDWDEFVALAKASKGATCCYWTLRLAQDLSGVSVPGHVLQALRPPRPDFVLRTLERHFVFELLPSERVCPSVELGHAIWSLGIVPGWSGHGRARPWHMSDHFLCDGHRRSRLSGWRKVRSHLRNARTWSQYLRKVLQIAPASS